MSSASVSSASAENGSDSTLGRLLARLAPRARLPLLDEVAHYSRAKFRHDIVAGAALALVGLPQAIGFSLILGVPAAQVVLAFIVGGLAGGFLFSSHQHVFGPTSSGTLIAAAALGSIAAGAGAAAPSAAQLAAFLALLIGGAQLLAGLLRFGEITKFISRSVIVAYGAAIGLTLFACQLRYFLGVPDGVAGGSGGFAGGLRTAVRALWTGAFSWGDAAFGAAAFALFALIHRWRRRWPETLLTLALLGAAAAGFEWLWERGGAEFFGAAAGADGSPPPVPFVLAGEKLRLSAGLPDFHLAAFSPACWELLPSMVGAAVAIAIIGMLEASAVTRSLAAKTGQRGVETNQELLGMGAGNVVSALFGGVPCSSSFTRSEVNYECGAKTQFAAMFGCAAVLAALLFVLPVFKHIPLAALAALLMRVGWKMVVPAQIRVACRSTRSDAAVFAVTLLAALFLRLDIAIYAGIGLSLALFLQKTSSPMLVEYAFDDSGSLAQMSDKARRVNPQIAIIHVEGELFFGASDVILSQVERQAAEEDIAVFILRLKNARHLDASTVMALHSLHDFMRKRGRHLLMSGCSADILRVLRNSGLLRVLGAGNVFAGDPENPNVSTKKALVRALELLEAGKPDARPDPEIRIFYDRRKSALRAAAEGRAPIAAESGAHVLDYQI